MIMITIKYNIRGTCHDAKFGLLDDEWIILCYMKLYLIVYIIYIYIYLSYYAIFIYTDI